MPEQADDLIERLTRDSRRWRRLFVVTLVAFVLAVAGLSALLVAAAGRERAAREEADQATREAERLEHNWKEAREEAERAARRAEQYLYASRISLAEKAWAEGRRDGKKP
jgi:hypothetical protein